jgi:hypothetical protein
VLVNTGLAGLAIYFLRISHTLDSTTEHSRYMATEECPSSYCFCSALQFLNSPTPRPGWFSAQHRRLDRLKQRNKAGTNADEFKPCSSESKSARETSRRARTSKMLLMPNGGSSQMSSTSTLAANPTGVQRYAGSVLSPTQRQCRVGQPKPGVCGGYWPPLGANFAALSNRKESTVVESWKHRSAGS